MSVGQSPKGRTVGSRICCLYCRYHWQCRRLLAIIGPIIILGALACTQHLLHILINGIRSVLIQSASPIQGRILRRLDWSQAHTEINA